MIVADEPVVFVELQPDADPAMDELRQNITVVVTELEDSVLRGDPGSEEKLITDIWVGIVLTLLVMSCVVCMCSCIVYHRFQIWKRDVLRMRAESNGANVESASGDIESLPSYTIVSGLPSYDEAIQQLKIVKQSLAENGAQANSNITPPAGCPTPALEKLSVSELLQLYKQPQQSLELKDDDKK